MFTKNTTEPINNLARCLPIDDGDVVLTTVLEHHSNDLPWRARVHTVHVGARSDGTLDVDDLDWASVGTRPVATGVIDRARGSRGSRGPSAPARVAPGGARRGGAGPRGGGGGARPRPRGAGAPRRNHLNGDGVQPVGGVGGAPSRFLPV